MTFSTFHTFDTFHTFFVHRISLLSVGKIKTPWIKDGCDLYSQRIGHFCSFSERILPAGEATTEQEKLTQALTKVTGTIVVLDELGQEMTSNECARWIASERDIGTPITFVIGGAYGVGDAVRAYAKKTIALSRMTLPHELCKLVFLEQLYRAHTILAGSGYHH